MRKALLFLLAAATAAPFVYADEYSTPGTKQSYTFTSLSQISESGVTKNGNEFTIANDITISATDTLTIENNAILKLGPKVQILVEGVGNFAPADTATIMSLDEADGAKGLRYSGDNASGLVKNICFETTALLSYATNGMTIENCTFNKANGVLNSTGAISFGPSKNNVVRNCRFIEGTIPAIGTGANIAAGVIMEDCYLFDNNTENANKPQINLTTPAENGPTIVRNNTIIGNKRLKVGGISIANMLGLGMGEVIVEGNLVQDHRYGMQAMGAMEILIKDNQFIDNRYETNPMSGGSALSITDSTGKLKCMVTGNLFSGSIWGITAIGQKDGWDSLNLGKVEDRAAADFNPGGNVFKDNGNDGKNYDPTTPYDLYNNSTLTIYAQGNTWSVPEQTEAEIEKVIFHKNDNAALGEVIFMPAGNAGVGNVTVDGSVYFDGKNQTLCSAEMMLDVNLFNMQGMAIMRASDVSSVDLSKLPKGIYVAVVKTGKGTERIKFVK